MILSHFIHLAFCGDCWIQMKLIVLFISLTILSNKLFFLHIFPSENLSVHFLFEDVIMGPE